MPTFKDHYRFDSNAITVATDDPDRKAWAASQSWTLCGHLKPLLAALLNGGAQIERADAGWSKAKLVVTLSKGLNPDVAGNLAKDHGLSFHESHDPHYLVAYGWFCEKCRHGVDWPQSQSTLDAIQLSNPGPTRESARR